MNKCIKCGSYAFNLHKDNIDQGSLCDVHYWQGRALRAEAQPEQESVAMADYMNLMEKYVALLSAQPEQEPNRRKGAHWTEDYPDSPVLDDFPITPPQRTWVGLTDEEMQAVVDAQPLVSSINVYFKAIETKLKEKNT